MSIGYRVALGWMASLMLLLGGCRSTETVPGVRGEPKIYHLRGKVLAADASRGTLTIDHQAIPGFMDAMTMSYPMVEPETISEVHPGDIITARVLVDANERKSPKLDEIVVVAQARPDTKPSVQYHVPKPGDVVPDFHLLNQSAKAIHLKQFRGRVVLLTFIYTRCPLSEFCPKMSGNFAEIDKALAGDREAYRKTHLVSVSFDPKYDTPAVLRSYGGAHTGRFTNEDFAHWEFAAPAMADLPALEQYFDVGVTGGDTGDPASVMHSLSTVLIGADGKVIAWYPSNEWKPAEVLTQIHEALRAP